MPPPTPRACGWASTYLASAKPPHGRGVACPCHAMPPHSTHRQHTRPLVWTTLGLWFGIGFDPNDEFLASKGTAAPEAAHSPDDRAARISLDARPCAKTTTKRPALLRSGPSTTEICKISTAQPHTPWRGQRALGTGALLRPAPHPAQPTNDAHQHPNQPPAPGHAPCANYVPPCVWSPSGSAAAASAVSCALLAVERRQLMQVPCHVLVTTTPRSPPLLRPSWALLSTGRPGAPSPRASAPPATLAC